MRYTLEGRIVVAARSTHDALHQIARMFQMLEEQGDDTVSLTGTDFTITGVTGPGQRFQGNDWAFAAEADYADKMETS